MIVRRAGGAGGRAVRPGGVGPPSPVRSSKSCVRASGWRSPACRRPSRRQVPPVSRVIRWATLRHYR